MNSQFKFKYLEIQLQKVEILGISTVCTPSGSLVIQLPPKSSLVIQQQEDLFFWPEHLRQNHQLDPKNCLQRSMLIFTLFFLLDIHILKLILELIIPTINQVDKSPIDSLIAHNSTS